MAQQIPVEAKKTKGTNLKKELEIGQLPATDGVNSVEGTKKRLAKWRAEHPIRKQAWTKQ